LFFKAGFAAAALPAHSLCTAIGPRTIGVPACQRIAMNEKVLSELSERLAQFAAGNPAKDLQRNFRAMLSSAFARLDLVSREEYDVQAQVLARTREKLVALEARVAEIEARPR
jgi:BMFP domain-containing protein YqiC